MFIIFAPFNLCTVLKLKFVHYGKERDSGTADERLFY